MIYILPPIHPNISLSLSPRVRHRGREPAPGGVHGRSPCPREDLHRYEAGQVPQLGWLPN